MREYIINIDHLFIPVQAMESCHLLGMVIFLILLLCVVTTTQQSESIIYCHVAKKAAMYKRVPSQLLAKFNSLGPIADISVMRLSAS